MSNKSDMDTNYYGMTTPQLRAKCAELQKEIDRLKGQGNTTGDPSEGREPRFTESIYALEFLIESGILEKDDKTGQAAIKMANHIAAIEDKNKGLKYNADIMQKTIDLGNKNRDRRLEKMRFEAAKAAMQGIRSSEKPGKRASSGVVVKVSLKDADALIKALDAKEESPEQPKDLKILWDLVNTWMARKNNAKKRMRRGDYWHTVRDCYYTASDELSKALQSLPKGYSREEMIALNDAFELARINSYGGSFSEWLQSQEGGENGQ